MRKPEAKKLTSERLQQFGFAYAPPLTISAAVNNKVFDTLQRAPKTVEQVTKETGGSPRGLRTIMDALVGLDLLKKDRQSRYSLRSRDAGHILHSEGEKRDRRLLKKTFRALKSGGTIAIAEWLVNADRTKPLPSLMFSVQMLVNTEKGGTFSFNEIKEWLEDAGFRKVRKLEAPGPSPLILATKA